MYYDERRKYVLGGLLLVLLAMALAGGWWELHKRSPGTYGAIALSDVSQGFGTAWGYTDPTAAAARAKTECAKQGLTDCAVRVSLAGTCGSLVMSAETKQTFAFAVTDTDKASAGALALAQCQATGASDCAVQANFCGGGL